MGSNSENVDEFESFLSSPEIKVEFKETAAVVIINRLEKRNALTHDMFR